MKQIFLILMYLLLGVLIIYSVIKADKKQQKYLDKLEQNFYHENS